jgi:hypothetical protein
LLANVYLHEVLDEWFEHQVKARLVGSAFLIRYADDFVIAFEREEDAHRVLAVLSKRFEKYGLRLHPEKTGIVSFRRPPKFRTYYDLEEARPETFDLLGFTHFWRRSRNGNWVIIRRTAKSRFSRALKGLSLWMRENRHEPIREQHRVLSMKLRGHFNYYGIPGNHPTLDTFRYWARRLWFKWLSRRSNASAGRWAVMQLVDAYPLPRPRVVRDA